MQDESLTFDQGSEKDREQCQGIQKFGSIIKRYWAEDIALDGFPGWAYVGSCDMSTHIGELERPPEVEGVIDNQIELKSGLLH